MDLNKFLEQNIITFLEKKDIIRQQKKESITKAETKQFSMDKDYYKLFQNALEKRDLPTAKKIFEEVQDKFVKAETDIEKKTYTKLIENMYADMKSFSTKEDSEKNLIKEITEKHEMKKESSSNFEERKSMIKKEIEESGKKISEFLQKNDLLAAMKEYEIMKAKLDEFPDQAKKEKKELFQDVIAAYYHIKKLKKIKRDVKEHKSRKEEYQKNTVLTKTKEEILLSTKKIRVFLKENYLGRAMHEYSHLKNVFDRFPKGLIKERKKLHHHIITVYKKIKEKTDETKRKSKKIKGTKKGFRESPQEKKNKEDLDFMMQMKKNTREIIMLLKERKLEEAELKLMDLKQATHNFPENKKTEKEQFEHLIEEISHRINFLKQTEMVKHA